MRLSLVAGVCAAAFLYATSAGEAHRTHLPPRALWNAFLCVHKHEGAWNANTGNGFFGGLQMDYRFQRTYGPEFLRMWGTANRWPPAVQMTVAMRAYETRGFRPWPATARRCGLL